MTESKRNDLRRAIAEQYQRLVQLEQERLAAVREEVREARDLARERIRAAERELSLAKERIRTERAHLKSAAQRFADMDPLQRSRAIAAMRQATLFGPQTLTRQQRQLLEAIGTRRAARFAEQAALVEARRAGFFQFFGAEERQNIARSQRDAMAAQAKINIERQVVAKLDLDEKAVANEVAALVERLVIQREAHLKSAIVDEVMRKTGKLNRMSDEQFAKARAVTFGG